MKKLLSKILRWLKNNYLALILLGFVALLLVGKLHLTDNLSTDNKWKSVLRGYTITKSGNGPQMSGFSTLSSLFGVQYTENYDYLIDECINKLKKNDKELYESIDNYTIQHKDPLLTTSLFSVGEESYQILDENNKDHYKDFYKKIDSIRYSSDKDIKNNKGDIDESKQNDKK